MLTNHSFGSGLREKIAAARYACDKTRGVANTTSGVRRSLASCVCCFAVCNVNQRKSELGHVRKPTTELAHRFDFRTKPTTNRIEQEQTEITEKRQLQARESASKLENVTKDNPTIDTLLRYAEVVGKRLQIP